MAFTNKPDTHIHVLCDLQQSNPSFNRDTLDKGNVLAFTWDVWIGKFPVMVEIHLEWLDLMEREVPKVCTLKRYLYTLPLGLTRVPKNTQT